MALENTADTALVFQSLPCLTAIQKLRHGLHKGDRPLLNPKRNRLVTEHTWGDLTHRPTSSDPQKGPFNPWSHSAGPAGWVRFAPDAARAARFEAPAACVATQHVCCQRHHPPQKNMDRENGPVLRPFSSTTQWFSGSTL